ncbi:hypothetical protein N7539_009454 [Penicillium diatomitis]|uniref:Stretch-activated cation channel Mid1 n=1 Tax=Penicillium diatomitis TaxID=2819901 RepID=A0A9W9WKN9_9EURO|nr:uncharacterized protein N7539_009454 [Penicillium diatomitis]KAJ5466725.1 hypothetical protein N7539_009454 [Penicillium diatomitis]
MRRHLAALQYLLAASITTALGFSDGRPAAETSDHVHALDSRRETESSVIGGPIISSGSGFAVALDSFNGLEMRDIENEEDDSGQMDLVKRNYPADARSLGNNQYQDPPIEVGGIQWFFITKEVVNGAKAKTISSLPASLGSRDLRGEEYVNDERVKLDLRKREQAKVGEEEEEEEKPLVKRDQTTVYLSLTTCSKPTTNKTDALPGDFPQLQIYYSTDPNLSKPGPGQDNSRQTLVSAVGGFANASIVTDTDIFIGVVAPNSTTWTGIYKYQIAASIDAPFHSVIDNDPFLYFIDADMSAALLVTNNLTQASPDSDNYKQWMSLAPPFTMFAHNVNNTALTGLERSYCALEQLSNLGSISSSTEVGMTNRGLGNKPKEQFYITGLNRSSTYNGILAMNGNSTLSGNGIVGGGGKVWRAMNFTTKTEDNCAVLFNLTFCSEVAYAVPANPKRTNVNQLRQIYDTYASNYYTNFTYSLQQVQCDAPPESMYSLAVNCSTCADAYKQWLCSVSIPRCEDFSNPSTFLQVRNAGQPFINGTSLPETDAYRLNPINNVSRNPLIDTAIQPGPYKEILPCLDICSSMVRACPTVLNFGCPSGEGLNASYGYRSDDGDITCSYLGAAYYLNGAVGMSGRDGLVVWTMVVVVVVGSWLM